MVRFLRRIVQFRNSDGFLEILVIPLLHFLSCLLWVKNMVYFCYLDYDTLRHLIKPNYWTCSNSEPSSMVSFYYQLIKDDVSLLRVIHKSCLDCHNCPFLNSTHPSAEFSPPRTMIFGYLLSDSNIFLRGAFPTNILLQGKYLFQWIYTLFLYNLHWAAAFFQRWGF